MGLEYDLLLSTVRTVAYSSPSPDTAPGIRIPTSTSPKTILLLDKRRIDWELLTAMLCYHEMAPFFFTLFQDTPGLLPESVFSRLNNNYYSTVNRYITLSEHSSRLLYSAKEADIPIVPIKGFAYAEEYYKEYGFRPVTDIDLLIKESYLEKGIELLQKNGFVKSFKEKESYWRNNQCHFSFSKNTKGRPVIVELHWALDFKRGKKNVLPGIWERIVTTGLKDSPIVLSPEDNLFSIALHQRRFGKMLNHKYACDTCLLIASGQPLDWQYIFKTAKKENIRASLFFLLAHTQLTTGLNLSNELSRLRIPAWQRNLIFFVIRKFSAADPRRTDPFYLYTLCHFLLYDSLSTPIAYLTGIPIEQFAKFYSLPPYSKKTKLLYKSRAFFIPYMFCVKIFREVYRRFTG